MAEEESDNKDTEEKEVDNKTPNLPPEEPEVKPEEPKVEEDPEKAKWMEDTGSLDNAYERSQGSREEVDKSKKELEEANKKQLDYEAQVAQELNAYREKDPEAFDKIFGVEATKEEAKEQVIDPKQITRDAAIEARAQLEVDNFYERNQDQFKDKEDWKDTQEIALSFVGKKDSEGEPFTIQTALRDATLLRHPELIGDKAISDHLTSQANRASASESGDSPTGDSAEGGKQSEQQDELAEQMGMTLNDETRERIAERQREKEA